METQSDVTTSRLKRKKDSIVNKILFQLLNDILSLVSCRYFCLVNHHYEFYLLLEENLLNFLSKLLEKLAGNQTWFQSTVGFVKAWEESTLDYSPSYNVSLCIFLQKNCCLQLDYVPDTVSPGLWLVSSHSKFFCIF